MLDIKYIRENPQEVIDRLAQKGRDAKEEIASILELDTKRRAIIAGESQRRPRMGGAEPSEPPDVARYHGHPGRPGLQHHNSERLMAAGQHKHIRLPVFGDQFRAARLQGANEHQPIRHAERRRRPDLQPAVLQHVEDHFLPLMHLAAACSQYVTS